MANFSYNVSTNSINEDEYFVPPGHHEQDPIPTRSNSERRATVAEDELEQSLNIRSTRKRFLALALYMICASFQTYTSNCLNPMSLAHSPDVSQTNI